MKNFLRTVFAVFLATFAVASMAVSPRPQTPVEPFPYRQQDVEFINPDTGVKLTGTVTAPQNGRAQKAVVLIPGEGFHTRDYEIAGHQYFLVLADYLTRAGIAVLRFDSRGVGSSETVEGLPTTENLTGDVAAALTYMRSTGLFQRVGLVGHGTGATLAFLVAGSDEHKSPDFIVSMAGAGVRGDLLLMHQRLIDLEVAGLDQERLETTMSFNRAVLNQIVRARRFDHKLEASLRKLATEFVVRNDSVDMEAKIDSIVRVNTTEELYNYARLDPRRAIREVKCQVLAINGNSDCHINSLDNLKSIAKELRSGGNVKYVMKGYPRLNHLFQECELGYAAEYEEIPQTISTNVLDDIVSWIVGLRFKAK